MFQWSVFILQRYVKETDSFELYSKEYLWSLNEEELLTKGKKQLYYYPLI